MEIHEIIQKKYLLLETYRKNKLSVQTPVWFVIYKDMIHVVTRENTGKIKRLRNNNNVKVALCSFNGKVKGEWYSGKAIFSPPEVKKLVLDLRREKYGFMDRLARFASRKKGDFIVFSINLD